MENTATAAGLAGESSDPRLQATSSATPGSPAPAPAPARLGVTSLVSVHPLSPSHGPSAASGARQQACLDGPAGSSPRLAASEAAGAAVPPSPGAAARSGPGAQDDASCGASGGGSTHAPPCRQGSGFTPECRICLLSEPLGDLVAACHCTGSLAYAHMACLKTWVMEKRSVHCELCGTMYKEPYGSELAASIPPAPPPPPPMPRRLTTSEGQPIIIMPVGVGLGPGAMGPLLQQHHPGGPSAAVMAAGMPGMAGMGDPRELEPQPLCEWRNMWSYALILLLLLFAIVYVTVISKRGRQEPWMMTLWQVLLVVLPIYLVLRVAFDLYRHRLAQQLAAANLQAVALANVAADAAAQAAATHAHTHAHMGGPHGPGVPGMPVPREVIITRAGDRVLVLQRARP